jgi:hypothetical protein
VARCIHPLRFVRAVWSERQAAPERDLRHRIQHA